jgi:DNA-binding XRE family transcriptional regulator
MIALVGEIKNNVQQVRSNLKMSKARLARRIGSDRSYITKLEKGRIQPSAPMMLRLAHVLKSEVKILFQLTNLPNGEAPFERFPDTKPPVSGKSIKQAEKTKKRKESYDRTISSA